MNKSTVIAFNRAYAVNATPEETQLVNDMLTVWGKFDQVAAKNPSMFRKGILFGIALQKSIVSGEIVLPEVRASRVKKKPTENGAI